MQDRGAFRCLGGILAVTILYFIFSSDELDQLANGIQAADVPVVMINGRIFDPSSIDYSTTDTGRMVIIVDEADLFVGENTVEIHWGSAPASMMQAELSADGIQKR